MSAKPSSLSAMSDQRLESAHAVSNLVSQLLSPEPCFVSSTSEIMRGAAVEIIDLIFENGLDPTPQLCLLLNLARSGRTLLSDEAVAKRQSLTEAMQDEIVRRAMSRASGPGHGATQ